MKVSKTFSAVIIGIVVFCCQSVKADCGKMWIYPYDWGNYWTGGGWQGNWGGYGGGQGGMQQQPTLPSAQAGTSNTNSPNYGDITQVVNVPGIDTEELRQLRAELSNLKEQIAELTRALQGGSLYIDDLSGVQDNVEPKQPIDKDVEIDKDLGLVLAPEGDGADMSVFSEPNQQAVIAWNGHADANGRETLILTTNEEATKKSGVLLSVLPLPGKPISVKPANNKTFVEAKALFMKRATEGQDFVPTGEGADFGVIMEKKIGSHNIFVWQLDNVKNFQRDVQAWVSQRFNNKAAALITDDTVRVLQFYFKQGFRYFAFDLTEVGPIATKQAIAYTFASTHVYYPLVISRIGGSNEFSKVDLVIMAPGGLKCNGAITKLIPSGKPAYGENEGTLNMGGHVGFTVDEVRKLDPSLDVFDSGTKSVRVRNVIFEKRLNSYKKDFTAVANGK
ncbi:MAG: hypothetical protein IJU03_07090 [Thermoguttaceae bacterium]|nr:hypothetical protein [Thermoguttaceae bacterium]